MKNVKRLRTSALVASLALGCLAHAADDQPSAAEMWKLIQQQQAEIEALKSRLGLAEEKVQETKTAIVTTDAKVEATSAYVEQLGTTNQGTSSSDGRASKTQIGGYGELHANFGAKDEIDFHRWVLFFSHDFAPNIRMFSEFELEHALAGEGKPGEVELEQAYVEFDLNEYSKAKAGLFLLPIGLLNETHEPDTFYGVERNKIENTIIPTTWWEAGAAYTREFDNGFSLDAALHSGLNVGSNFSIRSGRQKVALAKADDFATTARVTYSGIPGAKFGFSAQYQQDIRQGLGSETNDATLLSAHVDYERSGFGLRALYARWDISGSAPAALGVDEQFGYYIEPSYRFATELGDVGFFARYSAYDTAANSATNTEDSFIDVGVNYWPHRNVVLKADVQFTDYANKNNEEIVNLGVGYQF